MNRKMEKVPVILNTKEQAVIFEGWGTSLCWFAHAVGGWTDKNRNEIADLLFSKEKGLGLNLVRYNIWGGDHPAHDHMRAGSDAVGFWPGEGIWNWDADENQRWMLLAAKNRGADLFEAFSNSPPYWMTVSQCSAGAADAGSNLKEEYYTAFADYLTEVVRQYRDRYGIVFRTLEPLNEPSAPFWKLYNRQEGCHFDPVQQARLIKEVKRKLGEKGLNQTGISAADENSIDTAAISFLSYDDETKGCVDQINTHSYEGIKRRELESIAAKFHKRLWMTEYGSGGNIGHDHSSMLPALELAAHIITDINGLRPAAWVYWQAVEDEQGTIAEDGNWGLIHADMSEKTERYYLTKKYYGMGNFTRFIRPGYRMLNAGFADQTAFYSEEESKIVIVIYNAGSEEKGYTFLPETAEKRFEYAECYRTSAYENLQKVSAGALSERCVEAVSAPLSISTFIISCRENRTKET